MTAEDRKPPLAQMQRIQERIRLAEGPPDPTPLQNHIAADRLTPSPPAHTVAHIDLAQLQEAGIPTPHGGRTRVLDEFRLIKRAVLSNAAASSDERHFNLVMVTSAQPGEGKTFTALSLAMSVVADAGVPVLLVDLDIVKQDSRRRLGIRSEPGLIDVLADSKIPLSQALVQTDVPRLTVLPAGSDHPLAHELMAGPKMQAVMDHLSNIYRNGLVILDLAPVLVSADASVTAANVGQVILVVEANRTGRASIEQTLTLLQGCKRISLLLNKVDASELIDQYGTYYGEPYKYAKPGGAHGVVDRLTTYLHDQLVRSNKSGSS
jgi:protein-tyrosine kinase